MQGLFKEYTIGTLTILMGCRNPKKAQDCIDQLIQQFGPSIKPFLILIQMDLKDPKSCLAAAQQILNQYTRLDFLVLNAGILPADGVDLWVGIKNLLTRPGYVAKTGGDVIRQKQGVKTRDGLGETFMVNVFGHYILVISFYTGQKVGALVGSIR